MPVADSDMVVDNSHALHEGKTPNCAGSEGILSASLCSPAADILKNFYHTKRVGNYLIGRKLGEGSFAKVREGLHALTGEKVSMHQLRQCLFVSFGIFKVIISNASKINANISCTKCFFFRVLQKCKTTCMLFMGLTCFSVHSVSMSFVACLLCIPLFFFHSCMPTYQMPLLSANV